MANLLLDIELPKKLYHGTTLNALGGLEKQPINNHFLKNSINKDFGTGLYTTIDFKQAQIWSAKRAMVKVKSMLSLGLSVKEIVEEFDDSEKPIIVEFDLSLDHYFGDIKIKMFTAETFEWARYILLHRYDSSLNNCSCGNNHADIVIGQMADNDTGKIISAFRNGGKDVDHLGDIEWFAERIKVSKDGALLNGLDLGNQVAFFGEHLNSILSYSKAYTLNIESFCNSIQNNTSTLICFEDEKGVSFYERTSYC